MAESSNTEVKKGFMVLSFVGVTGTYDKEGKPVEKPETVTMSTGSTQGEGYCIFLANYHSETIKKEGKKKSEPIIDNGTCAISYALSLQGMRFIKKMYSPNEIFVKVLFKPGTKSTSDDNTDVTFIATLPKATLESSFLNKKVTLSCDGKTVCDDYYVHEIKPEYRNGVLYVNFTIFSPDKQMTMMEYCRTFLSKKLWSEIVKTELANYKLPYDKKTTITRGTDNSKFLNNGSQEHIFPYLVQYNESFYDFLKRTTNRWGEFLYYENKNLNIGYDNNGSVKEFTDKDYYSLTYNDLTASLVQQANVGSLSPEASDDAQMLEKVLEKGKYDIVKGEISSLFNPGEDRGLDCYLMKKLGNLLINNKTIWGFLVDQGVEDGLASATAETNSSNFNKQFDNSYFKKKDKKDVRFTDDQYSGDSFNEFSEFNPIVDAAKYAGIVKKEINSGRNMAVIDFDTTYPDVKLGQFIKIQNEKYLVVQVEGFQPEKVVIVDNQYLEYEVATNKVKYKVLAIPQNKVKEKAEDQSAKDTKFYPSLLPTGHVRKAGTQLAKVVDADDPARQNRVRVKFDWQSSSESPSPWLVYATPASTEGAGIHGKHYVDEEVMVNYVNGNVEHPYVIGAIEEQHPFSLRANDIVQMTPYGQRILMNDAMGEGATAFLASMNPSTKFIQGFFPGGDMFKTDASKSFAGGIELRDTYGIWSIKGSTDQRNISIRSPFGDVKIDAFTGITINAPNGDVNIKGKNVTIEAGSNLKLISGKNIKNKFAWEGEKSGSATLMLANAAEEIAKKLAQKVASLVDVSVIRHTVEIFVKPVEGKIEISSGRYLMLGAGGVKPDYPVAAYKKPDSNSDKQNTNQEIKVSFDVALSTINAVLDVYKARYNGCVLKKNYLDQVLGECVYNEQAQTKTTSEVLKAIWDNLDMDKAALTNAIGFKGILKELGEGEHATDDQLKFFSLLINELDTQEDKDKTVRDAVNIFRNQVVKAARAMQNIIKHFNKAFTDDFDKFVKRQIDNSQRDGYNLTNLRNVLVKNNLPNCIIKNIKDQKYDAVRNFTAENTVFDDYKKPIRRAILIKLVNDFNFTRSAVSNDPMGMSKATVPPVPSPDCSDAKWKEFVESIQEMPKVKKDESLFEKVISDPMLEASGISDWKNIADDFAFGSSKNGQILFSSQDGTMVLERNIYRAKVDHNDIPLEEQNGVIQSYIARVRALMALA